MASFEDLGRLICPSGTLLLLDPGLLPFWSYGAEPSKDPVPAVCRDLEIVGPDAWRAGEEFDRQDHPLFLYDIPDVEKMTEFFAGFCAERGLQASCRALDRRVPHRERVRLALKIRPFTRVQYVGMWAVAVQGLPSDRSLAMRGERMPPGEFEGRWRRLIVEVEAGEASSEETVDGVMVDCAQLLICDVETQANSVSMETSWGDGIFAVVLERGREGQILRLRVELGTEQRQGMLREVLLRGVEAVLSRQVEEGLAIREAERLEDGHWLFTTGEEPAEEMEAPDYFGMVALEDVLTRNPDLRRFMLRGPGTLVRLVQGDWKIVDWEAD